MRNLWARLKMWFLVWWTKRSLPRLTQAEREDAKRAFSDFCQMWIDGWGMTHEVEVMKSVNVRDEQGHPIYKPDGYPLLEDKLVKEVVPVPQPPRLERMINLGQGRIARSLLIMAYEKGSLQELVSDALKDKKDTLPFTLKDKSWEEVVDVIAANMIQVSHMAFPDLVGTYDYTQGWKRRL